MSTCAFCADKRSISAYMSVSLFEHPLTETTRHYLRLEHWFRQIQYFGNRTDALDVQNACIYLTQCLDFLERTQLKNGLLKSLKQQQARLHQHLRHPAVDQTLLSTLLDFIETNLTWLSNHEGKLGRDILDEPLILSLRHRLYNPGGQALCDLPILKAFLNQSTEKRTAQIQAWIAVLDPFAKTVQLLLKLLREQAQFRTIEAQSGHYQQTIEKTNNLMLLSIRTNKHDCYPTISGNRQRFSIRFLSYQASQNKLRDETTQNESILFDLALSECD